MFMIYFMQTDTPKKTKQKQSVEKTYFVEQGLVEGRVLSLQFMYFFVELCLNVGTFDLQVLQGVYTSLYNLW